MAKRIITPIPPGLAPNIAGQVNSGITSFKPYHAPSTPAERIGQRSMSEGREGLVRLVSRIALQHPNSLSRADVPAELVQLLDTDGQLETLRQACLQLLEMVDDTQFANSCDIMLLSDAYSAALQIDRKRNSALDNAMKEVDEWNERYRQGNPPPPAAQP
jgi:multidrug efflux pump subunit AcrB